MNRRIVLLLGSLLTLIGPGAVWAATCVQAVSVPIVEARNSNPVNVILIAPLVSQPANPAGCAAVLASGAEWANQQAAVSALANLSTTVAAQAASVNTLNSTVAAQASVLGSLSADSSATQTTLAGVLSNYQQLLGFQTATFDLPTALAAFAFFFSTVLFFYAVAAGAGAVLEKIRHPLGRDA